MELILDRITYGIDLPFKARFELLALTSSDSVDSSTCYLTGVRIFDRIKTEDFYLLVIEAARRSGFKKLRTTEKDKYTIALGFKPTATNPYEYELKL